MADAVARALVTNTHAVIEAGTGTGKTLAYLIPAVLSGKRVVVATATKALQEQLVEKDLPLLQKMAGNFTYAVMKGRNNYLCLLRQEQFDAAPTFMSREEAGLYNRLRTWAKETQTGDRAELDLPESYIAWRDVSSTAETCLGDKCPKYGSCHVVNMKAKAAEADIVVVNHHLFFADLGLKQSGATGAEVIPRYEAVILDEAHNMEEVATEFFGAQISNWRFFDLCQDVDRSLKTHAAWPVEDLARCTSSLGDAVSVYFDAVARLAPPDALGKTAFKPRTVAPIIPVAPAPAPAPPETLGLFDKPKPAAPRESTASDAEVLARARIVEHPRVDIDAGDRRDARWPLESD